MNEMLEDMVRQLRTLPDEEQKRIARLLEGEVRRAGHEPPAPAGRWSRLVDRMRHEAPMAGQSEAFLASVRTFREHFDTSRGGADG